MSVRYLVTGATSGLGGSVLATLYANVPDKSVIAAASSRADAAQKLQHDYPGIQFRRVDYDDVSELRQAFAGVERLFFVSSPTFDSDRRERQHENVVAAAKQAGVGHVYYSSLAFGGYGADSKIGVQRAHITTEKLLQQSGISYTSIREGVYTDAFPFFVFWYPDTTTVYLPGDGPVAFASRAELGEASARLMLRDPATLSELTSRTNQDNIALLTGSRTYTFTDVVHAISRGLAQVDPASPPVRIQRVSPGEYPALLAAEDAKPGHGGKSRAFFEGWLALTDGVQGGDAETVDPLIGELLGREPRDAMQHVEQLVRDSAAAGGYTWHQNYSRR